MSRELNDSQFVEVLTLSQPRLEAFALSLVRSRVDADDVLQSACVTLWEKRSEYDADRKFFSWACGVIMIQILKYREKKGRDKLMFDDSLINTLATEQVDHVDELDLRRKFLPFCINKLSDSDQRLMEDRYGLDIKPKEISEHRNLPLQSVYSALMRIRVSLHRCIEANLKRQSHC